MTKAKQEADLIRASALFDGDWYLQQYPDVGLLAMDAAEHYARLGWRLLRDPGPEFSTKFYLDKSPDVAASGQNPLLHYIEHGRSERRQIQTHVLQQSDVTCDIDVVVPVFNALEDVQLCVESLKRHRDGYKVRAIVVNDGSDDVTTEWLRAFCADKKHFVLLEHEGNRGYTCAVNTGLRYSTAPYVITLNSDTVVTSGWLRGMLRCAASSPDIGVVGPLSNAASWQNVPELLDEQGQFAINALPRGLSIDEMAAIVSQVSRRSYPAMPFINGFCFLIKRAVIDSVGYMDEEGFPVGYGEENDYCIRVADAGFSLAVADDVYVFHAKSKSFGHDRRQELSRQGSETIKRKHTAEKFAKLVSRVKETRQLDAVRLRIQNGLKSRGSAIPPMPATGFGILFMLPVAGDGGGAHSVVQEVAEMRRLGVSANVAVRMEHLPGFLTQYADVAECGRIFVGFAEHDLPQLAEGYDVVVATIFASVPMVRSICEIFSHILPAYYVQDYEPLFFKPDSDDWRIAHGSYGLVPGAVLFAKTNWICGKVDAEHNVVVHKVEPSIDHEVYRPQARSVDGRLHIAAMIRPQTPRRGAARTMRLFSEISALHKDKVTFHLFGCPEANAEYQKLNRDYPYINHGVLTRPEVARLLAGSDVFVDLSDYQAFGRTALEAMACGTAVMVTVHGGTDEFAIDGVNAAVVDSFDHQQCLDRLSAMFADDAALERMKLEGIKTASRYSVHAAAVSELALLSEKLALHRATYPKPACPGTQTHDASIDRLLKRAEQTSAGKDWRKAVLRWQNVLDQSGEQITPSAYVGLARAHLGSRDLPAAAAIAESGLSRFPAHYGLSLVRAEVLTARSQWAGAAAQWRILFDAAGGKANVWVFRKIAQALREIGDYPAAQEIVAQARALYPGDAGMESEAAELLMVEKQWSLAALHWSAVIEASNHADAKPSYAIYQRHVCQILDNLDAYSGELRTHQATNGRNRFRNLRIALFTAVVGSYDSITLPARFPEDVDYVLFTDGEVPDAGAYLVRPITYVHDEPTRSARYVKTHPHILLANYDIAIWIDGNILIEGDIRPLVSEFLDSGKSVAAIPHPLRRTTQEELRACGNLGKDDLNSMEQQLLSYGQQNLAASDLIESGFMMFDLREPRVPKFLSDWWRMIENHSKRDQLSLPYALARSGIEWHRLSEPPNSIRNHPCFVLIPHGAGGGGAKEIVLNLQVTSCDPYSGESYAKFRQERISAQLSRPIDIIVCVHNALEDVRICLDSIVSSRKGNNQRLIVVDDGSGAETSVFLKEFASQFSWVDLHRNELPGGYTKAANQGLAQTKADFCILLNSDTIVTDGWAEKLADAIYSTPGGGIVGPMSSAASHQSIPEHRSGNKQTAINPLPPGLSVEHMNRYCEEWTVDGILPHVPLVHGFCFGITRAVIEAIGYFDEINFPKGYGEENDYCLRASDAGFTLLVATHTYVFHAKSKSYESAHREFLMKSGADALKRIYGRPRLTRAIRSMENNPFLERMRKHAFKLYPQHLLPMPE